MSVLFYSQSGRSFLLAGDGGRGKSSSGELTIRSAILREETSAGSCTDEDPTPVSREEVFVIVQLQRNIHISSSSNEFTSPQISPDSVLMLFSRARPPQRLPGDNRSPLPTSVDLEDASVYVLTFHPGVADGFIRILQRYPGMVLCDPQLSFHFLGTGHEVREH